MPRQVLHISPGSSFFITLVDRPEWRGGFNVIGEVINGLREGRLSSS